MEELAGGELVAVIRDRRRFPWLGHEPKEVAIGEWRTIGGETSDRAGKKGGRRRTRPGPWTDSKVAGISAVIVLVDGTKLEEGAANVSRKVQRIATGVTDAVDGVQRLREVNGGSWDLFDSGGKLRVAVAIAKTDRMRRETVVAGMAMLDGDDPPRMAGRETELHESLIHLSYLRRRLIGQDCEVKPFAVSALEALKEGGAVSDTQARRLDQEFAPNGLGTDVLAPLRWCIERRRGWLV
jgi:hypothetical protein